MSTARERLAAWIIQMQAASADKRGADLIADQQSLDRAADLEAIYQDMSWVEEMPAPKKKRLGRRIDPRSREQFAKWMRQTYGWGSSGRLAHLHQAHELLPILLTAVREIAPTGERVLRPLSKLRAEGYGDYQGEVWQAAVRIAEGEAPRAGHVRRAVTEFLDRHKPPIKNLASDPRTASEKRAATVARLIDQFDELMADDNRAAHEAIRQMQEHFKAHQVNLRVVS